MWSGRSSTRDVRRNEAIVRAIGLEEKKDPRVALAGWMGLAALSQMPGLRGPGSWAGMLADGPICPCDNSPGFLSLYVSRA